MVRLSCFEEGKREELVFGVGSKTGGRFERADFARAVVRLFVIGACRH